MKPMTKVNMVPKRASALALLGALVGLGAAIQGARAQVEDGPNRLLGSWRVTVSVAEPQGQPAFFTLMTFQSEGTMMQSRPYFVPQFGAMETAHHGAWKRIGANRFAVNDFALIQGAPGNAALNGAFLGTDNVSFQPVLADDGDSFTAQWTSRALDPNGNPIVLSSGTMSGVRIQAEP